MSLEQSLVQQLPTYILKGELERRGEQPFLVPGIDGVPPAFLLATLVERLEKDPHALGSRSIRRLLQLLYPAHREELVSYAATELLDEIGDEKLAEALCDTSYVTDDMSDEDLWGCLSDGFRSARTAPMDGARDRLYKAQREIAAVIKTLEDA